MVNVSYNILKRRQRMHARTYMMLCLIVAALIGYYSYNKWFEYKILKDGIIQNKATVTEIKDKAVNERAAYETKKVSFDQTNKEIEQKLAVIFPENDDYTDLTRQIDEFEHELAKKNNPFEVSNIDYMAIATTDSYSILPMRMNINSSMGNFTKFLHLIETSGSLDESVRLMDISSIRLNFENTDSGKSENINFAVQINAYFQK